MCSECKGECRGYRRAHAALEARVAALEEALRFVRDWAVDAEGTVGGPAFDPALYGFDQIAQHCHRALTPPPNAAATPEEPLLPNEPDDDSGGYRL